MREFRAKQRHEQMHRDENQCAVKTVPHTWLCTLYEKQHQQMNDSFRVTQNTKRRIEGGGSSLVDEERHGNVHRGPSQGAINLNYRGCYQWTENRQTDDWDPTNYDIRKESSEIIWNGQGD
ncbi:hypothetical protein H920_07569 [Fukomys damarensis]|uniref:Uncharacterized protein n=1 Tax=Fukomys damarensis TaxID=885580 RepID=A0A091DFT9_FUKDA|nr:hypothetical protein H920_07569 [Fukomys damarensis]